MIKRIKSKDEPKGGWLGPPNAAGVPAEGYRSGKKWIKNKLTKEDKRKRKAFFAAMAKADKKGKWRVKWK